MAAHGGSGRFSSLELEVNRLLSSATASVVSQGLGPEWAADNQAESMLLDPALVIPIGTQMQGYLVSPRVQGLSAAPTGLEPDNGNWASVTTG